MQAVQNEYDIQLCIFIQDFFEFGKMSCFFYKELKSKIHSFYNTNIGNTIIQIFRQSDYKYYLQNYYT